jgi:hypothetical protein
MSHDSAGRRRKCHLRIDQRPRLLHRKPLRIISRASETIRNFICFVPRASATIERCNLSDVGRDPPRFVAREQISGSAPLRPDPWGSARSPLLFRIVG